METTFFHAAPYRLVDNQPAADLTVEEAATRARAAEGVLPDAPVSVLEAPLYALTPTEEEAIEGALNADPAAQSVEVLRCRFREGAVVCEPLNQQPRRDPEAVRPLFDELGIPKGLWGVKWGEDVAEAIEGGAQLSDHHVYCYVVYGARIGFALREPEVVQELARLLHLAGYDGIAHPNGHAAAFTQDAIEVLETEVRRTT